MLAKGARADAYYGWLAVVVLLATCIQLWGINRDLPHIAEIDEPTFVSIAVEMATTGNLAAANMGHPGTTLTYPLAAIYRLEALLSGDDALFTRAALMRDRLYAEDAWLYRWGRLLAGAYAVGAAGLLFSLGRRLLDKRVGLVAALLFMSYPGVLLQTKLIRTDSASIFFTLLALEMIWRWWDAPGRRRLMVVGLVIGMAIASKYYLATLLALPAGLILLRVWQGRHDNQVGKRSLGELALLLALTAAGLGLVHPYFYLDWPATMQMLLFEARTVHPGADGLGPAGNFFWYISVALPENLSPWQLPLSLFGVSWTVYRRRPEPFWLLGFLLLFVFCVSRLALHQARWLLPVLPILALCVGLGLVEVGDGLVARWGGTGRFRAWPAWALVGLALLPAILVMVQTNRSLAAGSTRVLAREWVVNHIPQQARIAYEEYSIDDMSGYSFMRAFALGDVGEDLAGFRDRGYAYVVVSSEMYNRYLSDPERFAVEAAFYRELFREGELLQEIRPSRQHDGPTIRVYWIG